MTIIAARTDDARAAVVQFIADRTGSTPQELVGDMPFEALCTFRAARPMGALLYSNHRGHSIELSAAGRPGWLTPGVVREIFRYPFEQLGCYNVLSFVKRSNSASRELCKRLGYQQLCMIRTGGRRADDMILYVMSRPSCRWLIDEKRTKNPRPLRTL